MAASADRIKDNIQRIRDNINDACIQAGRKPESVKIVAATKTITPPLINIAVESGIKILGENMVQEALDKLDQVKGEVSWHFIGHLQRNKVKHIVGRFEVIHAIDSIRLLKKIDHTARELGISQECMLSVNIARQDSKFGFYNEEMLGFIEEASLMDSIRITGLMTMPPPSPLPQDNRVYFESLRRLGDAINNFKINNIFIIKYSMGMSSDYRAAILEGATMIRLGNAIFGERGKL